MVTTKEIYIGIQINLKYLGVLGGLEEYLSDPPELIFQEFESIRKEKLSSEEAKLVNLATDDFIKLACYLHKAKGLIWEAIAHYYKIYELAHLLNMEYQGNEFKWDKERIKWYKTKVKTYEPVLLTYPIDNLNMINKYIGHLNHLLTNYLTYKKIIFIFLKHYKCEQILKPYLFEEWEKEYYFSSSKIDIVLYEVLDHLQCSIHVPEIEEIKKINIPLLKKLEATLETQLNIDYNEVWK